MLKSSIMRDSFNRTRGPGIDVNISRPTGTFLWQDQRNKDNIFVVRLQFMADTIFTGTVTFLCGTRGPWNIDSFGDASCRGTVIFFRGPEDQSSYDFLSLSHETGTEDQGQIVCQIDTRL